MKRQVITSVFHQTSQMCNDDSAPQHQRKLRVEQMRMIWIILMAGIAITGCAKTQQAREMETSGFIGDYSILRPGNEGEPLPIYKNPQADLSMYRSVYVDPVMVVLSRKSTLSREDLNKLADDFRSKVIWKLKEKLLVVPKLSPDALRIELALTEAEPSDVGIFRPSVWWPALKNWRKEPGPLWEKPV